MQVLRVRSGFQADHSSSSYLFYAVDQPVSAEGQRVAHRYSSRAEVDRRSARYIKWGESDLASGAFQALLTKHYDVMISESYSWWTLKVAVPKTPEMKKLLAPFRDARGYDDLGVDVDDYRSRLVVTVFCTFSADGGEFPCSDVFKYLVKRLAKVRKEILQGNVSFLEAVASYYDAGEEEDEEEEAGVEGRTKRKAEGAKRRKTIKLSRAAKEIVSNLEMV